MVLAARLAALRLGSLLRSSYVAQAGQAEATVEGVYPERPFAKGRPSVTQQARPYLPAQ